MEIQSTSSQYLVIRYHSEPTAFDTLEEAESFAMDCGDFDWIIKPKRPAQDEIDHYDSYDHDWIE